MSDWKEIVKTVAPSIAQVFGGPLAGLAVQAVSNAVLGKPDGKEDEISAALAGATPETLLALKKADQEFAEKMAELGIKKKELGIKEEEIAAGDRDSARKREIAVKDQVPGELALLVFVGFFGVLAAIMFINIPAQAQTPLNIMLGSLGTLVVTIATYYYGSSSSSEKKNDILADAINPKTKKCPHCGAGNLDDAVFCHQCGEKIEDKADSKKAA